MPRISTLKESPSGILLWIGLGVLGWQVTHHQIRAFEKKAARDIAELLQGDDKSVTVATKPNGVLGPVLGDLARATITAKNFTTDGLPLFTEPDRSTAGHIGLLEIHLENFVLKGLKIDRLDSAIPDCRYDRTLAITKRQIRLSRSGLGTGTVVISAESLEPWILKNVPEIKRVSVKIERGKVFVEGYGEFLIAQTDFRIISDLSINDGTQISLAHAQVFLGWQKADELSRKVLVDAMNPVVDLKKDLGLLDAFFLEKIQLKDGKIVAFGKTRIPIKPN